MKKYLKKAAAVGTVLAVSAGHAMAELPASVATDAAAAKVDIVEAGGIVIGIAIAIAAVSWVRRVFK